METPGNGIGGPGQGLKPYGQGKIRTVRDSFRDAWSGLSYVYRTQRNMRIHVFLAACSGGICLILGLGRSEVIMVSLAVACVLVAEVINTLTETFTDMMRPDYSVVAKLTKDIAAAAVLVAAMFSALIGFVAFYPALLTLPERLSEFKSTRLIPFAFYVLLTVGPSFAGLFAWKGK